MEIGACGFPKIRAAALEVPLMRTNYGILRSIVVRGLGFGTILSSGGLGDRVAMHDQQDLPAECCQGS